MKTDVFGGQAQKIENPDNLPEEHFWGAIFENITKTFWNSIVFGKFGKTVLLNLLRSNQA